MKPTVRYYDAGAFDGETEHRFMFSFSGASGAPGQSQLVMASELAGYLRYLRENTDYEIIKN